MLKDKEGYKHFLYNRILPEEVFTPEDFNDEQIMIGDLAREFVINEVFPSLGKIENQDFPETVHLIKKAGELGLIRADIPESDGGLNVGKVSATLISETISLGRSYSITFGGQTGIGALPIAYFGTGKQKRKYLPDILAGERITAYALTEPASGTDAMSIKTCATLSGCGKYYILNGEKQWITNSGIADIFIVYAKVDAEKFTAFIVEKGYKGVTIGPEEKKMGLKGSSTCSLILEDVEVPCENVIGEIGRGHVVAFNVLNLGRHKISATSLGTAKRAIELAAKYANGRKQFAKPIASFNLIKSKIADMAIRTYANESAVYRTAGAMQKGFDEMKQTGMDYGQTIARFSAECSMNKVLSTETLDFVVDEAVQIHGGFGYMEDYEVETLYRDSRISRIFEGTNEINRILIANTILKSYSGWPEMDSEEREGLLQHEIIVLRLLKELYYATAEAVQKYNLGNFNEEQEIAAFIADLVTGIYASESALLRTLKAVKVSGKEKNVQKIDCTKIFVHETTQQLAIQALNMLGHLGEEERFIRTAGRIIASNSENLVKVKRRIADFVLAAEKYSC